MENEKVELISSDGISFIITKKCAFYSKLFENLLSEPLSTGKEIETRKEFFFIETIQQKITLTNISSEYLDVIIKYMKYKRKWQESSEKDIPEFIFPSEMSVDLLLIADFLQI